MIHVFEEAKDFEVWMGSDPSDKHACDCVCVGSGKTRNAALTNAFDLLASEMKIVMRLLAHPPKTKNPTKG